MAMSWSSNWYRNILMSLLLAVLLSNILPRTSYLTAGLWLEQERHPKLSWQIVKRKTSSPTWYIRLVGLLHIWQARGRTGLWPWLGYELVVMVGKLWLCLLCWFVKQGACMPQYRGVWLNHDPQTSVTIGVQVVMGTSSSVTSVATEISQIDQIIENGSRVEKLSLPATIVSETECDSKANVEVVTPSLAEQIKSYPELGQVLKYAGKQLSGSARRIYMAKLVKSLGYGGQRWVEREYGWHRGTIRKGQTELENAPIQDDFSSRGRKSAETHLPHLLQDIHDIVEPTTQTDPTFKTTKLYTPLTAKEVRQRLIDEKGYTSEQLPTRRTINTKLNMLNFHPKKVNKCQPIKKIPETNAIFNQVHQVNQTADETQGVLRLSMDAKATIKMGEFSRGGKSRQQVKANDHDFADQTLTAFGIFLPAHSETFLYFTESKVTADFIVDTLELLWPTLEARFQPHTLVINLDNGPENNSHRTQFIKRMVDFAHKKNITIRLAYYPPYHSKYNPIERVWGILEKHWNGELLNHVEKILGLARTMTYNGIHPIVQLVEGVYKTKVKLTKMEMKAYTPLIKRLVGLEKWFVDIPPLTA